MKKKFLLINGSLLFLFLLWGCVRLSPIGKCTYSKESEERGEVTVISVEKTLVDEITYFRVDVAGFINRKFYLTVDEYKDCFEAEGFTTGSKLIAVVAPGGPCPPQYRLGRCGAR